MLSGQIGLRSPVARRERLARAAVVALSISLILVPTAAASFGDETSFQWVADVSDADRFHTFSGDVDGDGRADIGLYRRTTGVFHMRLAPSFATELTVQWTKSADHTGTGKPYPFQVFSEDMNGDGLDDVGYRNPNDGRFRWRLAPSFTIEGSHQWTVDTETHPYSPRTSEVGDFNGDGMGDFALREKATGKVTIRLSPTYSTTLVYTGPDDGGETLGQYNLDAADFNGDGKDDLVLRHRESGLFSLLYSPELTTGTTYQWLGSGIRAGLADDFNGDGRGDLALRNRNSGLWLFRYAPSPATQPAAPAPPPSSKKRRKAVPNFKLGGAFQRNGRRLVGIQLEHVRKGSRIVVLCKRRCRGSKRLATKRHRRGKRVALRFRRPLRVGARFAVVVKLEGRATRIEHYRFRRLDASPTRCQVGRRRIPCS